MAIDVHARTTTSLTDLGLLVLRLGAGAYSLDERLWGRSRWPAPVVIGLFVIALLAAVVTWIALNGHNPIHFTPPAG